MKGRICCERDIGLWIDPKFVPGRGPRIIPPTVTSDSEASLRSITPSSRFCTLLSTPRRHHGTHRRRHHPRLGRVRPPPCVADSRKPLITSHFAGHPAAYPAIFTDAFNHELAKARDPASRKDGAKGRARLEPVLWVNSPGANAGVALCHLERDGLRYLVPLSDEVNPLFGFAFLESFLNTLQDYLGEVTEVTVKDNFDIVYMVSRDSRRGLQLSPVWAPRPIG